MSVCVVDRLMVCLTVCTQMYDISSGCSPGNHKIFWQKPRLHHDIWSACCLCGKQGAGLESKVTVAFIYCQLLFSLCYWRSEMYATDFLPHKADTKFSKMWKNQQSQWIMNVVCASMRSYYSACALFSSCVRECWQLTLLRFWGRKVYCFDHCKDCTKNRQL